MSTSPNEELGMDRDLLEAMLKEDLRRLTERYPDYVIVLIAAPITERDADKVPLAFSNPSIASNIPSVRGVAKVLGGIAKDIFNSMLAGGVTVVREEDKKKPH